MMKQKFKLVAYLLATATMFSCSGGDVAHDIYFDAAEVRAVNADKDDESNAAKFEAYRKSFINKEVTADIWLKFSYGSLPGEDYEIKGNLIINDDDRNIIAGYEDGGVKEFASYNTIFLTFKLKDLPSETQIKLKEHYFFINNFLFEPDLYGFEIGSDLSQFTQMYAPFYMSYDYDTSERDKLHKTFIDNGPTFEKVIKLINDPERLQTIKKRIDENEIKHEGREFLYSLSIEDAKKMKSICEQEKAKYFNLNDLNFFQGIKLKVKGKIASVDFGKKAKLTSPFFFELNNVEILSMDWINPEINTYYEKSKTPIKDIYKMIDSRSSELGNKKIEEAQPDSLETEENNY